MVSIDEAHRYFPSDKARCCQAKTNVVQEAAQSNPFVITDTEASESLSERIMQSYEIMNNYSTPI